ncbi:MAG: dCTP deaminase [Candidatus Micrarchaeota archaeon]|nr:dCTP deaminase [Candidatus Micrarchaeota archaeon]
MILSKKEILKALNKGEITVTPFDKKNIGPCSIDLRLGNVFRVFKNKKKTIDISEDTTPDGQSEIIYTGKEGISIKPKELVLGVTVEKIKLPTYLCARIDGRTRFARLGLAVHLSSSLIQPGVDNNQVLEIVNMSPNKLRLKPGLKICQVVFEELRGSAVYCGAYRTQTKP